MMWKPAALSAAIAAITLSTSAPIYAQVTDSGMRISVVDQAGTALSNAEIEVIHVPTGTRKTYAANEAGRVLARGLQAGGPYIIKFKDNGEVIGKPLEGLYAQVGKTAAVKLLGAEKGDLAIEEVVIEVSRIQGDMHSGSGSTFNRDKLDSSPAIGRDFKNIIQQDSRASLDTNTGFLSIAGANNRYNSLTVDGIRQNDDFGLNLNGNPTNRSPVSLDSIESISLNIAPFDVEYGSFQGGNINVVTKSGSNEFHGTAFYTYTDDGYVGDKSEGDSLTADQFEDIQYGFTLGGPIIEDKLFFFTSYEKGETTSPFFMSLGNDDGVISPNEVDPVTQDQMDEIIDISRDVYGYESGGFAADHGSDDEKFLVKIDWNINDNHRFSGTYQNTDGTKKVDDFFHRGPQYASTESHRFNSRQQLDMYSLQLFSDWTDELSTEIKFGSKKVTTDNRSVGGNKDIGEFHIDTTSPNGRSGIVHVGPDHFRHANDLDNDLTTIKLKATYSLGDHLITAGYEQENLEVYNQFVPWSKGEFFYASIADFENQNPYRINYGNAITGNPADNAAEFETTTDTFYIQDEWLVTDDLTVNLGLRYETVTNDNGPEYNANFEARTGMRNDYVFDGEDILLPRLGFNYILNDTTTIRGGVGKFGGGTPNVWLSNSYATDGVRGVFVANVQRDFSADGIDGTFIPQDLIDKVHVDSTAPDSSVDAVKPGTPIPSVWKYNLAVDHDFDLSRFGLGDGWRLSLDAMITEVEDAMTWDELRFGEPSDFTGTAPDGRPLLQAWNFNRDMQLSTTDKGHGEIYTAQLSKSFDSDYGFFDLNVGYTHQHINEVNPGARFTAFDTYGSPAHYDHNADVTFAAQTETQHRVTANLSWSAQLFGDNTTSVSLAYSGRSGKNYSYTYGNSASVFGGSGLIYGFESQLMYVPTGINDPLVTYGANIDPQAFNDFINSEDCLSEARGGILNRNACQNDWVHRIDMRVTQDINISDDHTLQFYLDIENLGNLINDDWGRFEEYSHNVQTVQTTINAGGDSYEYSNFDGAPGKIIYKIPSVWKAQFGVKYTF